MHQLLQERAEERIGLGPHSDFHPPCFGRNAFPLGGGDKLIPTKTPRELARSGYSSQVVKNEGLCSCPRCLTHRLPTLPHCDSPRTLPTWFCLCFIFGQYLSNPTQSGGFISCGVGCGLVPRTGGSSRVFLEISIVPIHHRNSSFNLKKSKEIKNMWIKFM